MKKVEELLALLELEQIEENIFRGLSHSVGSKRVFGGQVLAQALNAAMRSIPEDRFVHSLHAYFILPGDIRKPIIFQVDRIRDGGSFSTRRVVAIQGGNAIFLLSASFQLDQEGFDHQINMPNVSPPEVLVSWEEMRDRFAAVIPENLKKFLDVDRPIEFRPVEHFNPVNPSKTRPFRHVWMRARGTIGPERRAQQCVLAYTSDYNLLPTALQPHGAEGAYGKVQLASLDHAMWFHRDFDLNDWLLYAIDSPSASNARGFTRGNIFTQDGKLVASVVQEGLMRPTGK